jgi:hypothetical protein
MLKLATDADVPKSLIRAVCENIPELDLVRVQQVGLRQSGDAEILEWAAANDRVLVTFDRSTMIARAYERVTCGLPMPGLICPDRHMRRQEFAEQIEMIVRCCGPSELAGQVYFLPI